MVSDGKALPVSWSWWSRTTIAPLSEEFPTFERRTKKKDYSIIKVPWYTLVGSGHRLPSCKDGTLTSELRV